MLELGKTCDKCTAHITGSAKCGCQCCNPGPPGNPISGYGDKCYCKTGKQCSCQQPCKCV